MPVTAEIELKDPYEKYGAELVKNVALKTGDAVDDGAATATVLAQAMVRAGLGHVATGADPVELNRGIDNAVETVTGDTTTARRTSPRLSSVM